MFVFIYNLLFDSRLSPYVHLFFTLISLVFIIYLFIYYWVWHTTYIISYFTRRPAHFNCLHKSIFNFSCSGNVHYQYFNFATDVRYVSWGFRMFIDRTFRNLELGNWLCFHKHFIKTNLLMSMEKFRWSICGNIFSF